MSDTVATIFGIYMLCGGAVLLLDKNRVPRIIDDFENSPALSFLGGAVILIAGLALLLHHNIWSGWPEIMVTLIAWGAVIEGAILMVYPEALLKFSRLLIPNKKVIILFGLFAVVLGAALIWF